MIIGLSLENFTLLHVIISLVAIASGIVVLIGMLRSQKMPGLTALFLLTTILTSATGFLFPIHGFTPALGVGAISLAILAVAMLAAYVKRYVGAWRWIYVAAALTALWFNVFVLIAQAFLKVPSLHVLAPNGNEPPFLIAQGVTLVVFVALGVIAAIRFRPASLASAVAY
jgi:hypothetical protein